MFDSATVRSVYFEVFGLVWFGLSVIVMAFFASYEGRRWWLWGGSALVFGLLLSRLIGGWYWASLLSFAGHYGCMAWLKHQQDREERRKLLDYINWQCRVRKPSEPPPDGESGK